jgi:Ca2+-binding RTX toxin-like protein
VDYSYEDRALVIAPDSQPDSGYTGEFDIIGADVENLVGGRRADSITGGAGSNSLVGNAGNDTIIGLSGDDTIRGGSGNDMMDGGDDADILDGGLGDDDFVGGTGLDTADYSNRTENLTIDVNDAADDGAAGELDNVHADIEIVESGSGRDSLLAASSGTQLEGGLNDDTLVGGVGNDTLIGGPDSIVGGQSDNDLLDGGSGADMMFGGAGTDFIDYSARTADVIAAIDGSASSGEAGEGDTIGKVNPDDPNMRLDVEVIRGGGGNDILTAADGVNCTLTGNAGNDTLNGGSGNDNLNGGAGDDVLKGNAGDDVLIGGAGINTADYSDRSENLTITLNDTADDGAAMGMPAEKDNVMADISIILGGSGNDTITGDARMVNNAPVMHRETISGGAGNDSLSGAGGDDELNGDAGNDMLIGGPGQDLINGGLGDDTINSQDMNTVDTVDGGAGTDTATRDLVDVLTNVEIEM